MSMSYCHKHDRHRDTDFVVHCPDCEDDIEEIEQKIAEVEQEIAQLQRKLQALNAEWKVAHHNLEQA